MTKPIRVFFSPFSRRFYATRQYQIDDKGLVTCTGEKFDVTNDIAGLIAQHAIEFKEKPQETPCPNQETRAPGIHWRRTSIQSRIGDGPARYK